MLAGRGASSLGKVSEDDRRSVGSRRRADGAEREVWLEGFRPHGIRKGAKTVMSMRIPLQRMTVLALALIATVFVTLPEDASASSAQTGGSRVTSSMTRTPVRASCPDKIVDRGKKWKQIAIPDFAGSESAARWAVVDPGNPQRLYVANYDAVLRSNDGGCTWKDVFVLPQISTDPPDPNAVTPVPACPSAIDADPLVERQRFTVLPCATIYSIDVAPSSTSGKAGRVYVQVTIPAAGVYQTIFAGTATSMTMIFVSDDDGETWSGQNSLEDPTSVGAGHLEIAPSDPSVLYAQRSFSKPIGGSETSLFISTDGGENWSHTATPSSGAEVAGTSSPYAASPAIDPIDPSTILDDYYLVDPDLDADYIGLFASKDEGSTWTDIEVPELSPHAIALFHKPNRPLRVVAKGSQGSLHLTDDEGANWRSIALPEEFWYFPRNSLVFGSSSRYLFLLGGDVFTNAAHTVARFDFKRNVLTVLRNDVAATQQLQSQFMPNPMQWVHGGGLYFLDGCDPEKRTCTRIANFKGRGA